MYREKYKKLCTEAFNQIDPKIIDTHSFMVGFFMGLKCDFKIANELTREIKDDERT